MNKLDGSPKASSTLDLYTETIMGNLPSDYMREFDGYKQKVDTITRDQRCAHWQSVRDSAIPQKKRKSGPHPTKKHQSRKMRKRTHRRALSQSLQEMLVPWGPTENTFSVIGASNRTPVETRCHAH